MAHSADVIIRDSLAILNTLFYYYIFLVTTPELLKLLKFRRKVATSEPLVVRGKFWKTLIEGGLTYTT